MILIANAQPNYGFSASCRARCVAEAELAFTPIALSAMLLLAVDQHGHD
jgi:hypothetical protein